MEHTKKLLDLGFVDVSHELDSSKGAKKFRRVLVDNNYSSVYDSIVLAKTTKNKLAVVCHSHSHDLFSSKYNTHAMAITIDVAKAILELLEGEEVKK